MNSIELSMSARPQLVKEEFMKRKHSNSVPLEVQAEVNTLAVMPENEINLDDGSAIQDWSGASHGFLYFINYNEQE